MDYERRFWEILGEMFVGREVKDIAGKGGYINLIKVKKKYFKKWIEPNLLNELNEKLKKFPEFKEELYRKLYTFFHRYFNETGSIYFSYTPLYYRIYEKVYNKSEENLREIITYDHDFARIISDKDDVTLFWKTHMLYYIKTDRIIRSMEIEIGDFKFYFDASEVEYKRGNEKKELLYKFSKVMKKTIVLKVLYKEGNKKTKLEDILKNIKKAGIKVREEDLKKAIAIFEKQANVDYFLNKDAERFLKDQFDLWMYQYIFSQREDWLSKPKEIAKLQILKEIAYKIIEFISLFEEELKKIWLKPRFVFNSNYVITLDRIAEKEGGFEVIEKLLNHKNFEEQIKEWKELGIVGDDFNKREIIENNLVGKGLNKKYRHLPVDTKYFKDLELEILGLFDNLDKELDGWLIKSENFQALNTILQKFKGKVQTIYIDPPFNTGSDFAYIDKFQDSTWLTLMENRLNLARDLLKEEGSIFVHLDDNADYLGRFLMNLVFGPENFLSRITNFLGFNTKREIRPQKFVEQNEVILHFAKTDNYKFFKLGGVKPKYLIGLNDENIENRYLDFFKKSLLKSEDYIKFFEDGLFPAYSLDLLVETKQEGKSMTISDLRVPYFDDRGELDLLSVFSIVNLEELNDKLDNDKYFVNIIGNVWNDVFSLRYSKINYAEGQGFQTQKLEKLLMRVILATSEKGDLVLDFFLGSGTTTAVAHELRRKWVGIEMAEHFWSVTLPRMKKVLSGYQTAMSKKIDWRGGGFFKYYEFEQYEDILQTIEYKDADLSELYKKLAETDKDFSPYKANPFLVDKKLLKSIEIYEAKGEIKVNLKNLYPDKEIDLAETLSNLKGKFIKKMTRDFLEFEDGEKIDLENLDYKLLKPLLWWG